MSDDDRQWMSDRLAELETRFNERLERMETTLLTEFHK